MTANDSQLQAMHKKRIRMKEVKKMAKRGKLK
jgi:hypothetical protein